MNTKYIIRLGHADGGSYLEAMPNGGWHYGLYRWATRYDTRQEAEAVAAMLKEEDSRAEGFQWNPTVEEDIVNV